MIMSKPASRLSLEEKCAQMVVADYRFDLPDPERIVALVKLGIGGVCFFHGSIFEVTPLVNSLQNLAKLPLLMASDFEDGAGEQVRGATRLPSAMAVGATGSEELAELKGRVTAREAVALGVPWVLAPVVDLQCDSRNPIINIRAFGEHPEEVARLARAFARGVRAEKGLTCAKHFPGHGDVHADSHLELPVVEASAARLRSRELVPYVRVRDEVDSVMTAHLSVPAFDPDRPASLSRIVTEDLLRKEVGFDGLVCTDALMMGGVTRTVPEPEALVLAAEAGADILLIPVEPGAAPGILAKAVRSGRIPERRIDEAVERVLALKERAGLFESRHADPNRIEETVGNEEHRESARRIAEAAVAKVRDDRNVLPLRGRVRLERVDEEGVAFRTELARHVELVEEGAGSGCVIPLFFRPMAFSGRTEVEEATAGRVREILRNRPQAVIVSFGSPYLLRNFPEAAAWVCAFSDDEASQVAAARALAGTIPFRGKMPVTL